MSARRRPWIAALLALVCNGLGHVYAGRTAAGLVMCLVWLGTYAAFVVAGRLGPWALMAAVVSALAWWIAQAGLAARAARSARDARRGWLSGPLGLLVFFLAATAAFEGVRAMLEPHGWRTATVASRSMLPTLWPGDFFTVLRGRPVERGAVIVYAPPETALGMPGGERVGRIVGVGGDTIEVRDGHLLLNGEPVRRERIDRPCTYEAKLGDGRWVREPCVGFVETLDGHAYGTYCTPNMDCGDVPEARVPQHHVWILGDLRDHSADSRVFGPVPEDAIVGRAAYVLFSVGPSGLRAGRFGTDLRRQPREGDLRQ